MVKEEERRKRDKVFSCDINTERLGSHAALSAPNVHDIRLRMCNAILRLRKFSDCVQHIQLKNMRLTIEVVSESYRLLLCSLCLIH